MVGGALLRLVQRISWFTCLYQSRKNPIRSVSRVYDHTKQIVRIEGSLEVAGNHTAIISLDMICLRLPSEVECALLRYWSMERRATLAIAITIISAHCSWILISGAALVRWLDAHLVVHL